jgi:hypothetical protein
MKLINIKHIYFLTLTLLSLVSNITIIFEINNLKLGNNLELVFSNDDKFLIIAYKVIGKSENLNTKFIELSKIAQNCLPNDKEEFNFDIASYGAECKNGYKQIPEGLIVGWKVGLDFQLCCIQRKTKFNLNINDEGIRASKKLKMPSGIVNFDNLLQLEKPFIVKEKLLMLLLRLSKKMGFVLLAF